MIRVSLAGEVCSVCGGPFVASVLSAVCDVWTLHTAAGPKLFLTNPRHGYHEVIAWNALVPEQGVRGAVP